MVVHDLVDPDASNPIREQAHRGAGTYKEDGVDPLRGLKGGNGRLVWDEEAGHPRCTANARHTGERCKQRIAPGFVTCKYHGSGNAVSKRAARIRLAALVDPAIAVLARAMVDPEAAWSDRRGAADSVLDRAGYPRRAEVNVEEQREFLLQRIIAMRQGADDTADSGDPGAPPPADSTPTPVPSGNGQQGNGKPRRA